MSGKGLESGEGKGYVRVFEPPQVAHCGNRSPTLEIERNQFRSIGILSINQR